MRTSALAFSTLLVVACSSTPSVDIDGPDASNARDGGTQSGDAAVDPGDVTPPGAVGNLAAAALTHTSVELSFTAPGGDGDVGSADVYEVRYATSPIEDDAAFDAAMAPPLTHVPREAGEPEKLTIDGLTAETEYHFAIRAHDAAGNVGPRSASVAASTKTRASFLISEVAPANAAAQGYDFVEIVATKAGWAEGVEVRASTGSSANLLLHTLGALEVAVGDRLVVHLGGTDNHPGFAQEDVTKDKAGSKAPFASDNAYDVYSKTAGLPATDSMVSVRDGTTFQDALPYSDRNGSVAGPVLTSFTLARTEGAWTFAAAPGSDCATEREAVNGNGGVTNPPSGCGGYPGYLTAGSSIQRNGVVDTNTNADFFVAPQTRGEDNAPFCAPEGARVAITEVNPRANLVELTVTQGGALRNFRLRRNPTAASDPNSVIVLPGRLDALNAQTPNLCAAAGDIVVVHLGTATDVFSETSAKDERPEATNPDNYDFAWDLAAGATISHNTSHVLALRNPANEWVDAAAFSTHQVAATEAYNDSLAFVQGLGLWMPADCNGAPCSNETNPSGRDLAASWAGLDTTAASDSCRRASPAASPEAASWSVGAPSWGLLNP
jgi:hypothetical protein